MRFRITFLVTTLSLACASYSAAQPLAERARGIAHGHYPTGKPYTESHSLGPEALPTLEHMLSDPSEKRYWRHIVTVIAYVGAPESFRVLREFVWNRFRGVVDDPTYGALIQVPNVLGAIPDAPGSDVTGYLEKAANPAFWDRLPWKGHAYGRAYHSLLMSKLSINGLACSASPKAVDALTRLMQRPYSERQFYNILEALEVNRVVRQKGLAYYIDNWSDAGPGPGASNVRQ